MDTNRTNMEALFQSYNTAFSDGLQAGLARATPEDPTVEELAMLVPSTGSSTVHAWLEQIPMLRKWVGDRQVKNIASGKLTIINDDYECTIAVKRNDIEDDQYGLYTPLMRMMGSNSQALWLKLAVDAMVANGKWADAAAFFGTTRKYGSNTISNYTTSALTETTFEAALQALGGFVGHNDEPLEVVPRYLVVGPKLRGTAWDLVKNTIIVGGTTNKAAAIQNRLQGACELRVSRRLVGTYDDYWFVLGEQAGIKPVAVQKRKEPVFTAMDKDTDETVFNKNEARYGTHARGASFLTLPHLAYGGFVA